MARLLTPDAQQELVEVARDEPVGVLRERARAMRLGADPNPEATYRRQRGQRRWRDWVDGEGMVHFDWTSTADDGAVVQQVATELTDRLLEAARRAGRREPIEAYRADALVVMARATGARLGIEIPPSSQPLVPTADPDSTVASSPPSADADDQEVSQPSLLPENGECADDAGRTADPDGANDTDRAAGQEGTVDVEGAGQTGIPGDAVGAGEAAAGAVGAGQAGSTDDTAELEGLLTAPRRARGRRRQAILLIDLPALARGRGGDGETCQIAGLGAVPIEALRQLLPDSAVSIVIRDGVDIRNVTHLGRSPAAAQLTALYARGVRCEVPGCATTHPLEIDHTSEWASTHRTRSDALAWLCGRHHDDKTSRGHHLRGPPGERRWHHPDGTVLAAA